MKLHQDFKFNDWELRGVPLRIEIGPKDVNNGTVMIARRYIPGKAGKSILPLENLGEQVGHVLDEIHFGMLEKATQFRDANIHDPQNYTELLSVLESGWAYSGWCGSKDCEAKVKEDSKATTRCMPLDQPDEKGTCIVCGKPAKAKVYFARAY